MRLRNFVIIFTALSVVLAAGSRIYAQTLEANPNYQIATSTESSRQTLQSQLQQKSQELDQINSQISAVNQQLTAVSSQKQSLQSQINSYNYQTKQLNLNLAAGELTVQQLALQIQSLGFDIQDIKNAITQAKQSIINIFQKIQQNDADNMLIVFLRNKSLTDSVLELQTLKDLEANLSVNVDNLTTLQQDLSQKISDSTQKQNQISLENENIKYRKEIIGQQNSDKQALLAETKNKESAYEALMSQLQQRQAEINNEVEAIDSILRTKIDPSLLPPVGSGILSWPVTGIITQGYGATDFAQTAYNSKWHPGIDIGVPMGTPIFASEDGTVVLAMNQDLYCYREGYGKVVVINGATTNLTTLYGHMSLMLVSKGDIIKKGQLIGYSGKTGYATGPHVHFGVYAEPTFYIGPNKSCGQMPYGGDLDPFSYLAKQ